MTQVPTYYSTKVDALRDLFGTRSVTVDAGRIVVEGRAYPIIDDVIVLTGRDRAPASIRQAVEASQADAGDSGFAADIQATFGAEWQSFPDILPEHETEFLQYFDVADFGAIDGGRVLDLGCGIGRWSYFLKDRARELVLVDFSDAIFVARRNLRAADNALFFLGDLTSLPFRDNCADAAFSLGVLHHLPIDALVAARGIARLAPNLLLYLYSAFDGRPASFRMLFHFADKVRRRTSQIESAAFRSAFTWAATFALYLPLIALGHVARPLGLASYVPLYDFYRSKSVDRIRQDVYDRFFTAIEQRFTRAQIRTLGDTFSVIRISHQLPYWHFWCQRADHTLPPAMPEPVAVSSKVRVPSTS